MPKFFVDTGAWVALVDRSDDRHTRAKAIHAALLRGGSRLVTTNLVVAESYNLIRRRLGHTPAIQFLTSLRTTARLERVYADQFLELEAETILRNYVDQDFSLVDAVSFVVMRTEGIPEAFAFDRHFVTAGFRLMVV